MLARPLIVISAAMQAASTGPHRAMLSIMMLQHAASNGGVTLDKSLLLSLPPRHHIGHPATKHRIRHRGTAFVSEAVPTMDRSPKLDCPSKHTAPCTEPCCLSISDPKWASTSSFLVLVFSQDDRPLVR